MIVGEALQVLGELPYVPEPTPFHPGDPIRLRLLIEVSRSTLSRWRRGHGDPIAVADKSRDEGLGIGGVDVLGDFHAPNKVESAAQIDGMVQV